MCGKDPWKHLQGGLARLKVAQLIEKQRETTNYRPYLYEKVR